MNFKIIILLFIFTIALLPVNTFSQTQAEIEKMMNNGEEKQEVKKKKSKKEKAKKPVNLKAELRAREKARKKEEKFANKNSKNLEKDSDVVELKAKKKPKKEQRTNKKNTDIKGAPAQMNFNKLKETGDKLGVNGSYYNALDYYNKALLKTKNDKKKVDLYEKLANASFLLRDYKSAESYYKSAINLNSKSNKYPLLDFQLANTYKTLGKYDSSVVVYNSFIEKEKENFDLTWAVRKSKAELKGSKYAMEYQNENPKFKIKNAGENINGPFTEYGPEIVDNRLYFSKINTEKVVVLDDDINEKEFSKIYYAEIVNDSLEIYQNFANNINEKQVHVGNPSFSKDGNTVYFTKCTISDNMQTKCKIYRNLRENNVWSKAEALNSNVNSKNSTNTQPQIVEQKGVQILYFVSDRLGGKGGKDIWSVNIDKEGELSNIKNIDKPINTPFDESSPHYNSTSKNFYFSSNGHVGFGGLDVFKVSKNADGDWNENVENMGLPVNSSLDDYDFVLDNTETIGYLASNRVGTTSLKSETCCDDIFAVNPTKIDLFVSGSVFAENETSRKILEKATLFLYDNKTNEKLEEIPYKNGKGFVASLVPEMDYKIIATATGFQDAEISFKTNDLKKSDTLEYNIFMKNEDLTGYILSRVYYEFDVSKLRSDAPDSLRKVVTFMNAYPNVIVEVGSHTDSKGSETYNMALSERRSLSVKNFLIYQKDISEKRLINKSYGESQPAAPNSLENGKDNPVGRDLNRRTEFKVIGYLKDKEDLDSEE